MKNSEITTNLDPLLPRLFSFAFAMVPDELQAEQLVIDAYAVFLVREKKFILDFDYNDKDKKVKSKLKSFLLQNMLIDIFELGAKRSQQLNLIINKNKSHQEFYRLDMKARAILFAKEIMGLTTAELQDIFKLEKFQVLEILYNTRSKILDLHGELS